MPNSLDDYQRGAPRGLNPHANTCTYIPDRRMCDDERKLFLRG